MTKVKIFFKVKQEVEEGPVVQFVSKFIVCLLDTKLGCTCKKIHFAFAQGADNKIVCRDDVCMYKLYILTSKP